MEGCTLPWRSQKIENNSPDLESYGKPLPPPPEGFAWLRNELGEFILEKILTHESTSNTTQVVEEATVIEHVVLPDDTLQGLCLRYRVSAVAIRRLNMFSGNSIQFKKILRIPVEAGTPVVYQQDTRELIIRKFRNATGEETTESIVYLDDNNWDLNQAVASWKEDDNWNNEVARRQHEHEIEQQHVSVEAVTAGGLRIVEPYAIQTESLNYYDNVELVAFNAAEGLQDHDPEAVPLLG